MKKVAAKYLIEGMALTRSEWVTKMRRQLEGALGEYSKNKFNNLVDTGYDWTDEVRTLLEKVRKLFDPNRTQTKTNFDRVKAFAEAVREAGLAQEQVNDAKNDFIRRYLEREQVREFLDKYRKHKYLSEDLLIEMLETVVPDIAEKLSQ